jgi:hypothetical protein
MHVVMFILFILIALVLSFMMTGDGRRARTASHSQSTDPAMIMVAAAIAAAIWSEIERETERRGESPQILRQEDERAQRKTVPTRSQRP